MKTNTHISLVVQAVIYGAIILLSGVAMVNGYSKVSSHMTGGTAPVEVTNYQDADYTIAAKFPGATPEIDAGSMQITQTIFDKVYEAEFARMAELYDVTNGADIDGHITAGKTNAQVKTNYDENEKRFFLYGVFRNLPELRPGYYYEGWLVKREPFAMISTGKIILIDQEMSNIYASSNDLSEYTHFVLSLEHNDEDTASETQILEGVFLPL